ncbi:conserved Plasmodium protein, unknown function [Plasmodium sp. gorilla clade G3]|nr:conserved Plasmodium protein, unknown function [Plasmodium sp. gorilla clade G3]
MADNNLEKNESDSSCINASDEQKSSEEKDNFGEASVMPNVNENNSSFFTKCFSKIVNFSSNTPENNVPVENKENNNEVREYNTNESNYNRYDDEEEKKVGIFDNNINNNYLKGDGEKNSHEGDVHTDFNNEEMINAISNYNKNELNLNRGEIYLNDKEYSFISYIILSSEFRFYPIEEIKKKKRRDTLKIEDTITLTDTKRIKFDNNNNNMNNNKIENRKKENVTDIDADKGNNDHMNEKQIINNSEDILKKEDEQEENIKKEGGDLLIKGSTVDKVLLDDIDFEKVRSYDKIMDAEERDKLELFDEILIHIKRNFYEKILNIETNFKNLENHIEDNHSFHFRCIIEKLKNRKYDNILYIYNDIYLYHNNLLFLSKPSSYTWMKLHELSNQITNTISDIHHKKFMQKPNRKLYHIDKEEKEKKDKKKEVLKDHEKMEYCINEEEKLAFQLLLSKLNQDTHFELFRKFKNKAVWKTLEGGEIELDDKLTRADVFREMYNWCKFQLEMKNKQSELSDSESDSSKDSY